jgi:pimeloyl-ACP methyl ester carboxylesterase
MSALIDLSLPVGIRSRHVQIATGLNVHILEAGEPEGRPLILLLHGFPELAYSWRKVMTPLAGAGYYVVAPDQRGYGRTTGWDDRFNGDLQSFTNLADRQPRTGGNREEATCDSRSGFLHRGP